jgi:hypothetical protein
MSLSESGIEAKLKREIEKRSGMCMKWVSPGTSGVPDRIVILPGNRVYFVELKSPKYKRATSSELQKSMHGKLKNLGCRVWVIKELEQLYSFLKIVDHDQQKQTKCG